jgi:hypothetical protein
MDTVLAQRLANAHDPILKSGEFSIARDFAKRHASLRCGWRTRCFSYREDS